MRNIEFIKIVGGMIVGIAAKATTFFADLTTADITPYQKSLIDAGGWGVCILALLYAIIHLWKELKRERQERDEERTKREQAMATALDQLQSYLMHAKDERTNERNILVKKLEEISK